MKIKKLVLKKTTIVELTDSNLKQIVGGKTAHTCFVEGRRIGCFGRVEDQSLVASCDPSKP